MLGAHSLAAAGQGHHRHIEPPPWVRREIIGKDGLDDGDASMSGDRAPDRLQNSKRVRILPIVQNQLQQIEVADRHGLEEIAAHGL